MDIDVTMIDNMKFTTQYLPGIQVYLVHDDLICTIHTSVNNYIYDF